MSDFYYPNFDRRTPSFQAGFDAWMVGEFDNPHIDHNHTPPRVAFLPAREWQHGQDVAFLYNQFYIQMSAEDAA